MLRRVNSSRLTVDELSDEVAKSLTDYANLTAEDMKKAIRKAADTVKKEIREKAPRDTGIYAKSWATHKDSETANTLRITVYAEGGSYRLTHLLENGHAKRGGGRVAARPHIAPAEEVAVEQLERDIEKALEG